MAKNKDNKNTRQGLMIIPILIICLLLLLIIVFSIISYSKNVKSLKAEDTLYYFYGDEINYGETSPDRIGQVYHAHRENGGDVNPKAITKSTYYFINVLVPGYYKEFSENKSSIKEYFEKNKNEIDIYTAIKSYEDFEKLVNAILNIKPSDGKLVYESSRFDSDTIDVDTSGTLRVDLYIKYQNCEEFKVKMSMKDTSKYTTSAIGYRIED